MAKRLLRLPQVLDRTGSNTTEIYSQMKAGTFPNAVPIGKRTVGWLEEEVEKWISDRIAARDLRPKRKAGPGRGRKGPLHQSDTAAA
jgi:prophage regulatory protein